MAISSSLSGDSLAGIAKPSPRSTAAAVPRSGTSLSVSATMKPTTATGAANKKTRSRDWA